MRSLSMGEARERLTRLPEELSGNPEEGAVTVTRRGEPVLAVMPWDFYETLVETLEIMADPELWEDLRKATREVASGKTISVDDLEARLAM